MAEAEAQLKAAKASTEAYKLNLDFTKVTSPIDGMVSRYYYTSRQPRQPGFHPADHRRLPGSDLRLLRSRRDDPRAHPQGRSTPARSSAYKDRSEIPVYMGLQGEEGFPHKGTFDFINNVVNPSTGSVSVRGQVRNPKPENGIRLLMPGMFVRIRLPIGQPHPALLVHRSGPGLRPGAEVRLRGGQGKQGPVPPRGDGTVAAGRSA